MSCCGGNCGCGAGCGCGRGCKGCKVFPDLTEKVTTTKTDIAGFAAENMSFDGFEMESGAEDGGCKCGSNCTCDPCTCK